MHNHKYAAPAFTVQEFCELHKIGRTSFYKEIQTGRLEAVKVGSKTLITSAAAARWLADLPRSRSQSAHAAAEKERSHLKSV
ncbi:helix-turn-helix domain-containing protein [Methylobacterium sp. PvR107]|uniref:helix-turn-helix domain-containing protein n=1 Tax=Methylobacterium sp. PvR107 TaxID=2806597 RepID=UPI001AE74C4A